MNKRHFSLLTILFLSTECLYGSHIGNTLSQSPFKLKIIDDGTSNSTPILSLNQLPMIAPSSSATTPSHQDVSPSHSPELHFRSITPSQPGHSNAPSPHSFNSNTPTNNNKEVIIQALTAENIALRAALLKLTTHSQKQTFHNSTQTFMPNQPQYSSSAPQLTLPQPHPQYPVNMGPQQQLPGVQLPFFMHSPHAFTPTNNIQQQAPLFNSALLHNGHITGGLLRPQSTSPHMMHQQHPQRYVQQPLLQYQYQTPQPRYTNHFNFNPHHAQQHYDNLH